MSQNIQVDKSSRRLWSLNDKTPEPLRSPAQGESALWPRLRTLAAVSLGFAAVFIVTFLFTQPQTAQATAAVQAPPSPRGSCWGACGGPAPGRQCWCDPRCVRHGDCCNDYEYYCSDRCGGASKRECSSYEYCLYPSSDRCGDAGSSGVCAPAQTHCPSYTMYVCGCDGKTYQNPCWAHKRGQAIRHYGPCQSVDPQKSCQGRCGNSSGDNSCFCDVTCSKWNDCCEDFAQEC